MGTTTATCLPGCPGHTDGEPVACSIRLATVPTMTGERLSITVGRYDDAAFEADPEVSTFLVVGPWLIDAAQLDTLADAVALACALTTGAAAA